jgi:uncharacterized membrane protein
VSVTRRIAAYWAGFAVLFLLLQLVIAQEQPDVFGLVVLAVAALPVAVVVARIARR